MNNNITILNTLNANTTNTNRANRQPTWAVIGQDVSSCANVDSVLSTAGIGYGVEKRPIYVPGRNGIMNPVAGQMATYEPDTDTTLGIVSEKYEIVPSSRAFAFMDNIEGIKFVTAGRTYNGMDYIIGELTEFEVLGDKFTLFVIAQNSYNGRFDIKATICPLRIVCQNQFSGAFRKSENVVSIRHSSLFDIRATALDTLAAEANSVNALNDFANSCVNAKVSASDVESVIKYLFPLSEGIKERQRDNIMAKRHAFRAAYDMDDNANFRGTVWGLVNAYTDYTTHATMRNSKDMGKQSDRQFMSVTFDTNMLMYMVNMANALAH